MRSNKELDRLAAELSSKIEKLKAFSDRISKGCTWELPISGDSLIWRSECGESFVFEDGSPKENGFMFCPYCGHEISEIRETRWGIGELDNDEENEDE
jgi:hypothetical protein